MKYSILTMLIVLTLFLASQLIGLTVNNKYFTTELPYGLKPPQITTEVSPWFFIGTIIAVTAVFMLMRKINLGIFMKAWFFLAFTMCVSIALSAFIESWIAFLVALVLILLKFMERDMYSHNISELLVYAGVVAIFAPILNLWAAVVILIAIAVYDVIAVFVTKHMIDLAKFQEKIGVFAGILIANRGEVALLGGGDIAFTMLFAVVVLKLFGWVPALLTVYGAAAALFILMLLGEKKKFYPAMPFIATGALLAFALTVL